jgi:hypothetical protein
MPHGRSHDERAQKIGRPRANNIPDEAGWDTRFEAALATAGRTHGVPAEGLVGAFALRARHSNPDDLDEGDDPLGPGSEHAPTARATERERERHRLERAGREIPKRTRE